MLRELLNSTPSAMFILGSICIFLFASLILYFIIRTLFPSLVQQHHNVFISVTSTSYGFLLGFIIVVIVILWQTYNQARIAANSEANHLISMIRDSASFPDDVHNNIVSTVREYAQNVRVDEWQAMRWGHSSPKVDDSVTKLFQILQAYSPQTANQSTYYHELINNFNVVLENRRLRLNDISSMLPDSLRIAIIVGAFVIIFFLVILETENKTVHLITLILISIIIGLNMGIAFSLDYPFSGEMAVSNAAFFQGPLA